MNLSSVRAKPDLGSNVVTNPSQGGMLNLETDVVVDAMVSLFIPFLLIYLRYLH